MLSRDIIVLFQAVKVRDNTLKCDSVFYFLYIYILIEGYQCFICPWEVREVERWEGSEMTRCQRRESDEVGRWEVPGFIQGIGTQGESKVSSFCF